MRSRTGVYRLSVGNPEGKEHLEDSCVDTRIILKLIFKKQERKKVSWIDESE
jgi:hypothetical protein